MGLDCAALLSASQKHASDPSPKLTFPEMSLERINNLHPCVAAKTVFMIRVGICCVTVLSTQRHQYPQRPSGFILERYQGTKLLGTQQFWILKSQPRYGLRV